MTIGMIGTSSNKMLSKKSDNSKKFTCLPYLVEETISAI